jgi:multidrug efflux pump subunit AcrA (membrane-fusion protein)
MSKKKKSKTKVIIWTVVIVIIVALVAIRFLRPKNSTYTDVKATTGNITTYYSFSGSVAAKNSQMLYADRAMQIKDINVTQGQAVKSGDVLMKTTSGQDITAPFDGTIEEVDAEVDAQLMPGAQLCKVVDYSNLQLSVQVDEYDISAITTGKSATVDINALNKNITGTVTYVSKEGIYQNGVTYFNATISLPSESDLMVGMSAQATVLNQSVKNVTILPMTAIQFDTNNNPYVYMKNGKLRKQVNLTLGINDGTNVQVTVGLNSGDTVLVPPSAGSATTTGKGIFGGMGGGNRNSNSSTTSGANAAVSGGSGQ